VEVVINKSILGTAQHLSYDGSDFFWVNKPSGTAWTLGWPNKVRDLQVIAKAIKKEIPIFPSEAHAQSWSCLRPDKSHNVPWVDIISRETYQKQLRVLLDHLWMLITGENDQYYRETFMDNRELLLQLKKPRLNLTILREIRKENDLFLSSVTPDKGGFVEKVIYDQSGSVTGRLTVRSGPNILTLKRENRRVFTSCYPGGLLMQVDISSLEPRIALMIAEKDAKEDVYSSIIDDVVSCEITREQAKEATLCCLYGMSAKNLRERLPDGVDAYAVLEEIRSYFRINDLQEVLREDLRSQGSIQNYFGRKITSEPGTVVNHFLQSTGVDVSLQCFHDLLLHLDSTIYPVFVIHDALVLDVPADKISKLSDILSRGLRCRGFEQRFPVNITNFCGVN